MKNEATVDESVFIFLFRCETCGRPIPNWLRGSSFEKAKKTAVALRSVTNCGLTDARLGSAAIQSWTVPWKHEAES